MTTEQEIYRLRAYTSLQNALMAAQLKGFDTEDLRRRWNDPKYAALQYFEYAAKIGAWPSVDQLINAGMFDAPAPLVRQAVFDLGGKVNGRTVAEVIGTINLAIGARRALADRVLALNDPEAIKRATKEAIGSETVRLWTDEQLKGGYSPHQEIFRRALAVPETLTRDDIALLLGAGVDIFGAHERRQKELEATQLPAPPVEPQQQSLASMLPVAQQQSPTGVGYQLPVVQPQAPVAPSGMTQQPATQEDRTLRAIADALRAAYATAASTAGTEAAALDQYINELARTTQARLADIEANKQTALQNAGRFIKAQMAASGVPTASGAAASRIAATNMQILQEASNQARQAEEALAQARLQAEAAKAQRERELADLRTAMTSQLAQLGLPAEQIWLPGQSRTGTGTALAIPGFGGAGFGRYTPVAFGSAPLPPTPATVPRVPTYVPQVAGPPAPPAGTPAPPAGTPPPSSAKTRPPVGGGPSYLGADRFYNAMASLNKGSVQRTVGGGKGYELVPMPNGQVWARFNEAGFGPVYTPTPGTAGPAEVVPPFPENILKDLRAGKIPSASGFFFYNG
jgi:hypothetical protein